MTRKVPGQGIPIQLTTLEVVKHNLTQYLNDSSQLEGVWRVGNAEDTFIEHSLMEITIKLLL